jgi:hypothetical protein
VTTTFALVMVIAAAMLPHGETDVTWTGWFSDQGCAESKVKSGNIGPNGTECVKRCLREGATAVFPSEQAKDMYEVKDYTGVLNDVGYHLEVSGVVDEEAKTISVRSVKRLAKVVQTCALPKRTSKRP